MTVALLGVAALVACQSPGPTPPAGATSLARDVYVVPVADGVWRHVSFRWYPATGPFPSNGLLVRTADGSALLVDTAWNDEQTASILDFAEQQFGSTRALVITHAHDDRLGGIAEVHRRGVPSVALRVTGDAAAAAGWPAVSRAVEAPYRLEELGVAGELFFPGAAHTRDNAVVYLEGPRVLAGSCMIRSAASTSPGNLRDADVRAWPTSVRRLEARYPNASIVVPGHGEPGGPELLTHTLHLVEPAAAAEGGGASPE